MKPCNHPYHKDTCRICFLCVDPSEQGMAYRRLWNVPEPSEHTEPGIWRKAWNFATAAVVHAAKGMPKSTPEELARRLDICQGCPLLGKNFRCHHRKCGCDVRTKAAWEDQHCPVAKW